MVAGII